MRTQYIEKKVNVLVLCMELEAKIKHSSNITKIIRRDQCYDIFEQMNTDVKKTEIGIPVDDN